MNRPNLLNETYFLLLDRNNNFTERQLHKSLENAEKHKENRINKFKGNGCGHAGQLIDIYKITIKSAELLTN